MESEALSDAIGCTQQGRIAGKTIAVMPWSCKWTVVDTQSADYKMVRAKSQCEATLRGLKYDLVARKTHHVRPRDGDTELMSCREFREFFRKVVRPFLG